MNEKTLITTKSGAIRGFESDGLLKYLGIPFAQPPVGALRFKRARPVLPWDGVLEANAYGDAAAQFNEGRFMGSENCLTLNVVRPAKGEKLPVFVWIHGGGYMTGTADDTLYHGDTFARDGVLFVSIQYRLNVFGVYDFSTYPNCADFETNCALSDMVEALRWIHENIAAFGGDPERITIGGESAGGAAVVALMAVPAAKGLFQQVIAESALCNCVMTPQTARRNTDLYLEGMGWTVDDLPKLRTADAYDLIRGTFHVNEMHQYRNPGIFLPCPVIDDLLPVRPIDAIRAGCASGVKLIIGTNLHEGTMFVHPEGTGFPNSWEMVEEMFRKNENGDGYAAIKSYYANEANIHPYSTPFVDFATDYAFQMPSVKLAEAQRNFADVWMYRFELLPNGAIENGMLVSHAFELPCVFGVKEHPFSRLFFSGETEADQDAIIHAIHDSWVRFIRASAPDPENWPVFDGAPAPVRIFDRTTATKAPDRRDMMAAWGDMRFYEA